ncbi:protein C1orf43 homolog [Amphiura filiformis]|uniref:protein C1orf43 homolog n=1 Tax=Amphiura filiformis TaxID=82378 RepID=UPI003B220FF4
MGMKNSKINDQATILSLILIVGFGTAFLCLVVIFAKRQIMRYALRSRRSPHTALGHNAPRDLQNEIERRLQTITEIKLEPKLLADDDYRLQFLTGENCTGEKCTYLYRMKAVDALSQLDEVLKTVDPRLNRPSKCNLKEYLLGLREPPLAPLKGTSASLCKAFADSCDHAQYGYRPFGEPEYNNYMALLYELMSSIRHKGHKSKRMSQHSILQASHQAKRHSTTSHSSENIHGRPSISHVPRKGQPPLGRPDELVGLIERTHGSRGSDLSLEGIKRRQMASSGTGRSDEVQPLVIAKHARTSSTSESAV